MNTATPIICLLLCLALLLPQSALAGAPAPPPDPAAGVELDSLLPPGPGPEHTDGDALYNLETPEHSETTWRDFFFDAGQAYLFMWATRFVYVRNKDSRIFDTSLSDWIDNIFSAPETNDGDDFNTNIVLHPIAGSYYYLYFRNRQHSKLRSALGSFTVSALWEYGIEGMVEKPSLPDLIYTPLLGVPLGMGLDSASKWLLGKDNTAATIVAHVLNPIMFLTQGREAGLLNPLTGQYSYVAPFEYTEKKKREMGFVDPFYSESPFPVGRFTARFEVATLGKGDLDGQLIMYSVRADFPSGGERYGLYFKLPYAGVNDAVMNGSGVSDGFEVGNILIGTKKLLYADENSALGAAIEVYLPTSIKDNRDRLATVINFRRDLPLHLFKAATIGSYVTAAVRDGMLSAMSSAGMEIITNAVNFERDEVEMRFKYNAAVGLNPRLWANPSLVAEINGITMPTAHSGKNDLFLSGGIRFGKKISPGIALQIPVYGPSADIAGLDIMFDMQAWF